MRIILISNYELDQQESMSRFAQMLKRGLVKEGHECEIWRPNVVLGRYFRNHSYGIGKWLGYIDKWIIYPVTLRVRSRRVTSKSTGIRFHVCDHSNAPYLRHLPAENASITCHDVLAIRGALGFEDAHCPASKLGAVLQKWILKNLLRASKIGFDSEATMRHLFELSYQGRKEDGWRVIHCAINAHFAQMEAATTTALLNEAQVNDTDYILHVGSNLPRKNRKVLIDVLTSLGDKWNGNICFAGQSADEELLEYAAELGYVDRVFSVENPTHEMLNALYCGSSALMFPSWSEGFGWPVIEAQACGTPVIASRIEPMPEVGGAGAFYADPGRPETFSEAFLSLSDPELKNELVSLGFQNVRRFDLSVMTHSYIALFDA